MVNNLFLCIGLIPNCDAKILYSSGEVKFSFDTPLYTPGNTCDNILIVSDINMSDYGY